MDKFNFIVPDFSGVQFTSAPHQEGKKKQNKNKNKKRAHKTKACIRLRNNWKCCFMFFITFLFK